ncbi:VanZ family protein [Salisediminibacterium beveridgei]|uniref:VanZ-like domain-containing protein n=1 Tax=Salisediminibacterium beveridgei TaxID=632773 RepID=A0A1D7QXM3_9BACI|nr:VanZ family protein [Salisediminibacterium beveridgei]AOM83755.1 hypothetical protein BBEV_2414 [Salisediminibacterium beveridgei]
MRMVRPFFLYWIPVIILLIIIFTASAQTSDQQDIQPVLDRLTDRGYMGQLLAALQSLVSQVFSFVVTLATFHITVTILIGVVFAFIVSALIAKVILGHGSALRKTMILIMTFFGLVMIGLSIWVMINGDQAVSFITSRLNPERLRSLLGMIEFTYAGSIVSLEAMGLDGLLRFLFRKAAHVILYGMLGYFLFLGIRSISKRVGFVISTALLTVIAAASLDEYQQSLTPTRSGLIEDVILDSAAGLIGIVFAWLWVQIVWQKR